jgi:hypothetical protein
LVFYHTGLSVGDFVLLEGRGWLFKVDILAPVKSKGIGADFLAL